MRSQAGFSLIELMVVLGLAGILTAIAIPVFTESSARNQLWTGSELIGAQIRQARLKAISRNTTFQVRFDCPAAGQFRSLVMTGVAATDDAADRCSQTLQFDSGVFALPPELVVAPLNSIQVNGRGNVTAIGAAVPYTLSVSNGEGTRTLIVSLTGQVTFSAY